MSQRVIYMGHSSPPFPIDASLIRSGVIAPARLGTGSSIATKFLRGDGTWQTTGTGDALTTNTLAQFAPTTSAQLAGVISDETGSGALVFANTPTLVTPVLGVATATSVNKVIVTAPATTATLTLANNSVFRTVGNDVIEFTSTADTALTLPTSGSLMVGENNLTELANTDTAMTNLGLNNTSYSGTKYFGSATAGTNTATLNIGTSTGNNSGTLNIGTASAGNNSRVINIGTASGTNTSQVNIGGTLNKYTLTAPATAATITLADNSTLTTAGNFTTAGANNLTLTTTGSTNVTLPTAGLLLSASNNLSDVLSATTSRENLGFHGTTFSSTLNVGAATGGANSGTFNFGAATANNSSTLNIGTSSTGTNTNSATVNIGTGNSTVSSVINIGATASNVGNSTVNQGFTNFRSSNGIALFGGASGTNVITLKVPSSGITTSFTLTLPNSQGSPGNTLLNDGSGNFYWASVGTTAGTLAQFASTTSAQLAGIMSDETGSGSLVFATSPTLVTPVLGAATATSINGATITTTTGTLTLANGSTLATSGGFSTTLTTTAPTNVTLPTTGTLATLAGTETLTNKTLTSPILTAPALGTPASGTMTNVTGNATGLTAGTATNLAGGSGGTLPYQSAAGTTAMLSNGTAGQYLQSNGTTLAPSWVTPAGLTGFTASLNTSSPNNTVNASMILASGGTTNQDAVVSPKGAGAFQLQLADSTTTGGNKRGTNAIDLQTLRTAAAQVASGVSAVVIGVKNTASSDESIAIGELNTASSSNAIALGHNNTVSAAGGICIGASSSATTVSGAMTFGGTLTSSATYAISMGYEGTSSGSYSFSYGWKATATLYGQVARANGYFTTVRDAQVSNFIARRSTSDATQTELMLDGSSSRITIGSGKAWSFVVRVFGSRTDAGVELFHSVIQGSIANDGGTTALEGANTTTTITDTSGGAWAAVVEADNTNDALVVKVTGAAAKTIRWVASIEVIETTT